LAIPATPLNTTIAATPKNHIATKATSKNEATAEPTIKTLRELAGKANVSADTRTRGRSAATASIEKATGKANKKAESKISKAGKKKQATSPAKKNTKSKTNGNSKKK